MADDICLCSVKGWIIDPYVQSFLDSSHEVLVLSKILNSDIVTSDAVMVKYWEGDLEMFLEPLSKSSRGLSNVFLLTLHPVTFVSIYDSTSFLDRILVFGSHKEVFDDGKLQACRALLMCSSSFCSAC